MTSRRLGHLKEIKEIRVKEAVDKMHHPQPDEEYDNREGAKWFLDKLKQQAQSVDEDYVTDFLDVGMDYYRDVLYLGEARDEIKRLLQSHRPSITREEIEGCLFFNPIIVRCLPGPLPLQTGPLEKIIDLFKSKGIEVKEKP